MASASLRLHALPAPSILPSSSDFQNPAKTLTLTVRFPKRFVVRSSQGPLSESEEDRWLREERRWLREEQRWLREESRWNSERDALDREITTLKLEIEVLKRERLSQEASVVDLITNLTGLLQTLKGADLKSVVASSRSQIPDRIEEKHVLLEEEPVVDSAPEKERKKKKRLLRKGSEGEDVRAMQKALQKLGFYSGEEDVEFSTFSSGTESAVKTWQASVGLPEDGVMTLELLERLHGEVPLQANADADYEETSVEPIAGKDGVNGSVRASSTSVTEVSEIKEMLLTDNVFMEAETSEHKVFLLGENRWEEPSRLAGSNKQIGKGEAKSGTKCLACRGEGRLMCTECDGTGEPNVEEQFLDWVEDGAKCPYCEGLGYTICDVCDGRAVISS
ncbi:protein disulfide isomerase pTAC5, chloroplastic isoform X2 [Nymphaea colorata]|nr:protein disulfide isomerase pTAC5, chloroplastic isoform X2 [Nymphaea colorata]XP_031503397.1 protein disulfide isomerase pTAC5, chloroplastic isoform X2 [Nymphaea colorata]